MEKLAPQQMFSHHAVIRLTGLGDFRMHLGQSPCLVLPDGLMVAVTCLAKVRDPGPTSDASPTLPDLFVRRHICAYFLTPAL